MNVVLGFYFLNHKSQTFHYFKIFKAHIKHMLNIKPKELQSDSKGEYLFEWFFLGGANIKESKENSLKLTPFIKTGFQSIRTTLPLKRPNIWSSKPKPLVTFG